MKVRLRDWADLNRISERTVQIRIKEHWDELQEHIERRGKQGTWLDDYAQEFLLERIQLPKEEEVFIPSAREAALMYKLNEMTEKFAAAERDARLNAEAAGKVLLLEEVKAEQAAKIDALTRENAVLSADKDKEKVEHQKTKDEAQRLSDELTEARKQIEALENRTFGDYLKGLFRKK